MQLTETRREPQAGYAYPPANQAKHFLSLSMSTTRVSRICQMHHLCICYVVVPFQEGRI
jgi:hypothetical protein